MILLTLQICENLSEYKSSVAKRSNKKREGGIMLSDIEIAQQVKMLPVTEVAEKLGINRDDLELYGKYKAKLSYDLIRKVEDRKPGKLVMVTAITPTPAGEGKSTTTVGLAQGLQKIGKKVIVALREPSQGPCFGIKGGAAGGG